MTVTIEVPASVPARLRRPEGDPGGADALATTLYAAAGRYEEFADRAREVSILGSWTGMAYQAYKEASAEASGEHSAMSTTVRRVGRGVTAFADSLRDLVRDHEELVERKRGLDERRTQLISDINGADPSDDAIAAFRERSVDLRTDYSELVTADDDLARLAAKDEDGTISPLERRVLDNSEQPRDALANADAYTDPLDPGAHPGGQLWLYDPAAYDGDSRVAVAIGDLDAATDVALMTPGITTDMQDTVRYTDQMMNLYESTRYNGDGSSVATMYWLGYDAPHGPTDLATMTEGRAEEGGRNLADAIDGLRASRSDDPAHLTAIGHSYGSTTKAYGTHGDASDVDEVVLIGSPGAGPADHASDLGPGREHVYVGRDSRDFVAVLGDEGWIGKGGLGLGTDPSSEDFDATRFEAEDVDRSWHRNTGDAHSSYLDNDTESLYNIGRIVDGHGDRVVVAEQSYDPWYGPPVDPEATRDPTEGVDGRSNTTDSRRNSE